MLSNLGLIDMGILGIPDSYAAMSQSFASAMPAFAAQIPRRISPADLAMRFLVDFIPWLSQNVKMPLTPPCRPCTDCWMELGCPAGLPQ